METGIPRVEPAAFTAKLRPGLCALSTMSPTHCGLDRRRSWTCEAAAVRRNRPRARACLPSGPCPAALNLPYGNLVAPDGTLLPPIELRQRVAGAGIRFDRPIIGSCGSGGARARFYWRWRLWGLREQLCTTDRGPNGSRKGARSRHDDTRRSQVHSATSPLSTAKRVSPATVRIASLRIRFSR